MKGGTAPKQPSCNIIREICEACMFYGSMKALCSSSAEGVSKVNEKRFFFF